MCFCVPLPSGRLGPACAEVGLGFALLGWFRRFRPPPPPLVWFRVRRPSLFFFLAFSGFCPFRARCVVLVFALSCVPLFASWLSNFHVTFTVISFSSSFHLPRCCGTCVCNICIDVKLHIIAGGRGISSCGLCQRISTLDDQENVPALNLYIYIVPPLGAFKTQLGGHIFYRCCFIRSMSTVIIRLYMYIYNFILRVNLTLAVFARLLHSTSKFDKTVLITCVCVCVKVFVCKSVCV